MILIVFCVLVAIAGSTLAAYKSSQSSIRRIIGGLLLFFSTFLLIISATVSESDFFSILIVPLFFSIPSIGLLYPTRKKLYITVIAVCTVYSAILSSCNNYTSNKLDERWDNIELITKNIDGTIWQNIEPNYDDDIVYWYRIEFKDGSVYYYEASPSDGKWDAPKVFKYSVGEERYSNTGEKYRYVQWIDSISHSVKIGYKFSPRDETLHTWCTDVGKSEDINMTEGDTPAWRD